MMPQVARKVIELVADQNSNAAQLATLLEKDPNITTRILKIANSAFYGLRRECKTVQHAIMILGFKSLRSMVVASSSKALHKRFGIAEQLMWDHSIGTAIGGKLIAEGRPTTVGEIAFVGGLLHNVGKTIMNNECPKAYMEVMKRVYNQQSSPIAAEMEVFKYGHPEVGYRVTEKWGLPDDIAKIIRFHLVSEASPEERKVLYQNEALKQALACVELATTLCRVLGIGFRDKNPTIDLINLESTKVLGLTADKLTELQNRVADVYQKERSVFT